ncbi:hypothetical protein LZ017_15190, partial [Pelomonas sp. CA6]
MQIQGLLATRADATGLAIAEISKYIQHNALAGLQQASVIAHCAGTQSQYLIALDTAALVVQQPLDDDVGTSTTEPAPTP